MFLLTFPSKLSWVRIIYIVLLFQLVAKQVPARPGWP